MNLRIGPLREGERVRDREIHAKTGVVTAVWGKGLHCRYVRVVWDKVPHNDPRPFGTYAEFTLRRIRNERRVQR